MYSIWTYKNTDKMSDLICNHYQMLSVMSRFDIKLGFGDKTIDEVCVDNGVDTNTFLAVINISLLENNMPFKDTDFECISISALINYLKNSHIYFLEYRLPSIRRKLIEAIDLSDNDVSMVIMRYYDEYVCEVRKHMQYEEDVVFPYVNSLMNKQLVDDYSIDVFSKHHDSVESKLSELKNIIIKYYPAKSSNALNGVLFDIFSCAEDLLSHNTVEDKLFIPAIRKIERNQ